MADITTLPPPITRVVSGMFRPHSAGHQTEFSLRVKHFSLLERIHKGEFDNCLRGYRSAQFLPFHVASIHQAIRPELLRLHSLTRASFIHA